MKIPLLIAVFGAAIAAAIVAVTADTAPSGPPARRPQTVDPISGMIIPAEPANRG